MLGRSGQGHVCGGRILRIVLLIVLLGILPEAKSGLTRSSCLKILIGSADLLIQGVGQIFGRIPDKFKKAIVLGLVVDYDGTLVDFAANSDDVATYQWAVGAHQT